MRFCSWAKISSEIRYFRARLIAPFFDDTALLRLTGIRLVLTGVFLKVQTCAG
jgi:hypothetical protein